MYACMRTDRDRGLTEQRPSKETGKRNTGKRMPSQSGRRELIIGEGGRMVA